jgi:hypothetical protein
VAAHSKHVEVVIQALKDLGGLAHLSEIERQCSKNGDPQLEQSIRRTVEHDDLFYSVDGAEAMQGFWGLRGFSAQMPDRYPIAGLGRQHSSLLPREETPLFNVRGIAYRDGFVLAIQVDFAPGAEYPDTLSSDGRILRLGEGTRREQSETAGNAGMLDARTQGYAIPVYQATGPNNKRRYAFLGYYQVVDSGRTELPLRGNDFTTNAFVFTLEPVEQVAARDYIRSSILGGAIALNSVGEPDIDEPPPERDIPDNPPRAPSPGEYAADPMARAQALERRIITHHLLVLAVRNQAKKAGLRRTSTKYADLMVRTPTFGAIFEMKNVGCDLQAQLMTAIGQLFYYHFLHRRAAGFDRHVRLYAVCDAMAPASLVEFLREIGIGCISIINGKISSDPGTRDELSWLYADQ